MRFRYITTFTLLTVLLAACNFSLAEDVTPPPDYQSPTPPPTMGPLYPQGQPSLANGAMLFAANCAPCHGPTGKGDGPQAAQLPSRPAALASSDVARPAAPADWFVTVTQGDMQNFMPPFSSSLSDQQRWDLVAYALSLSTTGTQLVTGKEVYEANCAKCHGEDGKMASGNADLTDQASMAKLSLNDIYNVITKGTGKMQGMSSLSASDAFAVAAYVRTFTFPPSQEAAVPQPTGTLVSAGNSLSATSIAVGPVPFETGTPPVQITQTPAGTTVASGGATPGNLVGMVSGKIINGTGGNIPPGLMVILHGYDHDVTNSQFNEVLTKDGAVASDGSYHFDNLPLPSGRAYFVSVDYAGTTYDSDPAMVDGTTTSFNLPVTIYDTTTDGSVLIADQLHILLDYSKPNIVQVVEFFIISNPTNKTVIASQKGGGVVAVSLPQGFSNLQFEQGQIGQRYLQTSDGFADTQPVPPSKQQYQLVFAYGLPYTKELDFKQLLRMDVSSVSVLVPAGVKAKGNALSDQGVRDIGNGTQYEFYSAGGFNSGQMISFSVTGAPSQSAAPILTGVDSSRNIIIGVGAFGVVLIVAGIWLFWRDRRKSPEEEETEEDADRDAATDANELMDAIIALDDQYRAGNIVEEAYKERREELKTRLKEKL